LAEAAAAAASSAVGVVVAAAAVAVAAVKAKNRFPLTIAPLWSPRRNRGAPGPNHLIAKLIGAHA
jgi:hypothetical protein